MKYSVQLPDGRIQIKSHAVFCATLGSTAVLKLDSFSQFLTDCEDIVKTEFQPTRGALNNVRGKWYEWLLSIGAIEIAEEGGENNSTILLSLPNVDQFDHHRLYQPEVYGLLDELKKQASEFDVSLVSSNPDFVLIQIPNGSKLPPRQPVTPNLLNYLDRAYEQFVDTCRLDSIVAYLSVKSSLRPDRRLQMAHEGALVKAFYQHLRTRLWQVHSKGLKYYGASINVGKADRNGLKTIATHSILSVDSTPERAVDELFVLSNPNELRSMLRTIGT